MKSLVTNKLSIFPGCTFSGIAIAVVTCVFSVAAQEEALKKVALPIPERLSDLEESGDLPDLEGMTYDELDESRATRKLLIDYLIKEGRIRESPKGTLDFLDHLNDIGTGAVKEENRTRRQMFTLIGEREKRSYASIGREFHELVTAKPNEKPKPGAPVVDVPPSLRINAPLSVGNSILPGLVNGYLESLGYGDVKVQKQNQVTRMIGRRSFGSGFFGVEIEGRLPGSIGEPRQKCVLLEIGGSGGAVPPKTIALEGLAIVVHPDNPVSTLTVAQVADIFSGKITQWDRVSGGEDEEIAVLIPDARPALVDQLRSLVLKPERERLIDIGEDTEGAKFGSLAQLGEVPNGITLCHPREITGKVKAIRIRASSDSVALAPSSINLKALDYPLVRYVSLRAFRSSDSFIQEFLNFAQSGRGQQSISKAGYIGIGIPTAEDGAEIEDHGQVLLDDTKIPDEYKDLIRKADRRNSPMNFRFVPGTDNFELTGFSQANLEHLIQYLRESGNRNQKVILIGFADSYGDSRANRTYSGKRADSIADRLREKGITNILTAGMGEEMPIADNDDEDGRAANRRVEVWLER